MAKKLPFNVLSDRTCTYAGCQTFIKQRLVDKDPTGIKYPLCYKHYTDARLRHIATHNNPGRKHV